MAFTNKHFNIKERKKKIMKNNNDFLFQFKLL